ncbi:MAG TPA: molybdenum ABC transporter ATP-binding protein [Burkholderiaceae bacterium]|nr:molybdenum ABC transporter ATP-binding protein [Burkholderiaceae bacterium]
MPRAEHRATRDERGGPIEARFALARPGFTLDVDLRLAGSGVTALFGPSGSGKTTLLRCIAGLIRAPQGRLSVAGEMWQDDAAGLFVPTHRRPLGMVFQDASLFAHLSVQGNLDYARRRVPRSAAAADDFDAIVALLGIGALLARMPANLSGGERQRVAIARALLTRPRLLLLDEPLAALDVQRKREILPYLERLHDELALPVLYVTHSPDEAARLADDLVLLQAGRVVASGPLTQMLARLDLPLAAEGEATSVIEATVQEHDAAYHLTRVAFPGGALWVGLIDRPLGARVRARVHARDVSVALTQPEATSVINVLPAVVTQIADDGPDRVNLRLDLGGAGTFLLARITRRSRDALALAPGMRVYAQVKGVALM